MRKLTLMSLFGNANNWKSISLQIWQTVDIIFNQHLQCLMMTKESKKVLH